MQKPCSLEGVDALLFDVFGTVVDWLGSMESLLVKCGERKGVKSDWNAFAKRWRKGYMIETRRIAAGGLGPSSVDEMHRQILDTMLTEPEWEHLSNVFTEEEKDILVHGWHHLSGWPDSTAGLYALKKNYIICTLSNGNVRLLADMAKHSDLPWDVIFSGELLGSYKPNPKVYNGAAYHLSLPTSRCALVAAHIEDLRAAEKCGMRTIYVKRPTEDIGIPYRIIPRITSPNASLKEPEDAVLDDSNGTEVEVDVVTDSFVELAKILATDC